MVQDRIYFDGMIGLKISACVITKNEEKNITHYLERIKPYVQEIVFVDTGSTDKTVKIARQQDVCVYHYEWRDDFAAAKNFALGKASGDWIVFLDADEFFSAETADNLSRLLAVHGEQYDAFLTKMVNIDIVNGDRVLDAFYTVRVFRRRPEIVYEGKIHERIVCKDGKALRCKRLKDEELLLYHTGYSADQIKAKAERNLKMIKNEVKCGERMEQYYVYLAEAYDGIGDDENAVYYAMLDIQSGKKNTTYASRSYRILIEGLKRLRSPSENLREAIEKAMLDFPDMPDFYAEYALFFYERQDYDHAVRYFRQALALYDSYDHWEPSILKNALPTLYELLDKAEKKCLLTKGEENGQGSDEVDQCAANEKMEEIYQKNIVNIASKVQWLTIITLLRGNSGGEEWRNFVPTGLHHVIARYLGKGEKLSREDFSGYCSMLDAVFCFNETRLLRKYLQVGLDFESSARKEIMEMLVKRKRFSVMDIFLPAFHETDFDDHRVCYWAGIVYFREKKDEEAESYFRRAVALGATEGDVASYLAWIEERR